MALLSSERRQLMNLTRGSVSSEDTFLLDEQVSLWSFELRVVGPFDAFKQEREREREITTARHLSFQHQHHRLGIGLGISQEREKLK